jgi:hypothetical protein
MPASRLVTRVVLLALLLVVSLGQATDAALGIYLRASILSWDSPATQLSDALASELVPRGDVAGELLAGTRAAAAVTGWLVGRTAEARIFDPALASRVTRSPPAA